MVDARALGKVVIITGASSGIGRATALMLAQRGDRVVLVSRQQEALDELAAECRKLGGAALAVAADVADGAAVDEVAQRAGEEFGRLDVWVNNAAVTLFGRLDQVPPEDFRRVLETNLFGYINGARAALDVFRRQGSGTLINIASVLGKSGQAWADAYVVSKFGIMGLSSALRQGLYDQRHIRVVTIVPPSVDTPLFQHGGNFTGRAARALQPAVPAAKVAAAIVRAIDKPRRQIAVGTQARLGVLTTSLFPVLSEPIFSLVTRTLHFDRKKPQPPTHGNLFTPDPQWNKVGGGWNRAARLTSALGRASQEFRGGKKRSQRPA